MALKPSTWGKILVAVIGALGLFGRHEDAAAKPDPKVISEEALLQARVDKARQRLIKELGQQESASADGRKVAQWYNWPNWYNWNNWRNW